MRSYSKDLQTKESLALQYLSFSLNTKGSLLVMMTQSSAVPSGGFPFSQIKSSGCVPSSNQSYLLRSLSSVNLVAPTQTSAGSFNETGIILYQNHGIRENIMNFLFPYKTFDGIKIPPYY